ncbi:Ger(x)C family spore germination protein [Halalkalibacter lacteus]|uniref:Ger(x)C family spore germination protein n=1 Tax=Halalkalibacter lacteus TaxID=3090663 RepID=UPI002FC8676F
MKSSWSKGMSIICMAVIILSGCWDQKELDNIALVTSVGVDTAPEEDMYLFTFQILIPRQVTPTIGGGGGDQAPITIITQKGKTMFEAVRRAAQKTPGQLYFPHMRMVVFSDEVAKEGVKAFLDVFERDHELRPLTTVLITNGIAAKTVLSTLDPIEMKPSESLLEKSEMSVKRGAFTARVDIDEIIKAVGTAGKDPYIGGVKVIGQPPEDSTTNIQQVEPKAVMIPDNIAVFQGDKLKGWLQEYSARGLLWVLGKVESTIVNVECEKKEESINVEIIRSKSQVIPLLNKDQPEFTVKILADANIGETECFINLTDSNEIDLIQEKVMKVVKKEAEDAISEVQKHQSDVLGLGAAIFQEDPEQWGYWEKDWDNHFSNAKVNVEAQIFIRQSGLRNKPLEIQ